MPNPWGRHNAPMQQATQDKLRANGRHWMQRAIQGTERRERETCVATASMKDLLEPPPPPVIPFRAKNLGIKRPRQLAASFISAQPRPNQFFTTSHHNIHGLRIMPIQ